jgi:hypothetical protein
MNMFDALPRIGGMFQSLGEGIGDSLPWWQIAMSHSKPEQLAAMSNATAHETEKRARLKQEAEEDKLREGWQNYADQNAGSLPPGFAELMPVDFDLARNYAIKQATREPKEPSIHEIGDRLVRSDGSVVYEEPNAGQPAWRPLTPEEVAQMPGFEGGFMTPEGPKAPPKGTTVNVGDGKLTEGQSKDVGFYARGRRANAELTPEREQALTVLTDHAAGQAGTLGNYAKSPEYRQAEQAAREFLAIVLRKDTGAAVTPAEFELYGPMYLPMPNDDPATIEMKRAARKQVLDSIKLGLGNARGFADEIDAQFGNDGWMDAGDGVQIREKR